MTPNKKSTAFVAALWIIALPSLVYFISGGIDTNESSIKRMLSEEKRFIPSYVSARPGPVVKLTTYITEGLKPMWDVQKNDKIVYMSPPKKDGHISQFRQKDVMELLQCLKTLRPKIPQKYRNMPFPELIKINVPKKHKMKMIQRYWFAKRFPILQGTIDGIIKDLNMLVTRKDPERPWTLTCDFCFKNEYPTLLDPIKACAGNNEIDIVAIVTSIPKSVLSRKTIRETWGSWTRNNTSNFRLIFLFGKGWSKADEYIIENESEEFGDILLQDFQDHYFNLTQKVISAFKWVLRSCPRAKFIMRAADDGFVNVPEVLHLLQTYGSHPRFQGYQIGDCFKKYQPHRTPDFKNYHSTDEYSDDSFPPFAVGTNFIISNNLTKRIVRKSQNITFVPHEDAYFGLVLRAIGSGCQHVSPYTSAYNALSDSVKKKMFNDIKKSH